MTRISGTLTRNCPRCGKEITYATFQTCYEANKKNVSCMSCSHLPKHKRGPVQEGVKFCNKCKESKPTEEYNRNASQRDGLSHWCGECMRKKDRNRSVEAKVKRDTRSKEWYNRTKSIRLVQAKEYRDTHPEIATVNNLKFQYVLTPEQTEYILTWPGGKCSACGKHLTSRGVGPNKGCVDHDHSNDKFRSILCHHCNRLIGMAKEKIEVLQGCIEYLLRWKENQDWLDFADVSHLEQIRQSMKEAS